ncbi:protein Wnt-11 isoform X1 [Corvus cornix cornix]|uniref:protein Wnt-11 isoform X1 n=1 Tax=Corvus cornix cornix TaxID=932674 RepID=UPI000535744A|nr:protein Wnt-11 isoform X1 [Corvus cornix cornix]
MLIRADITPHIKADGAAYKAAPGAVPSERTRSSRSLARVEVISFGKQEKVEKMKPSLQFFLAGFLLLILQTGLCYGIKWIGLSKTPLALTLNQTQHCKQLEGLVVSQVQLCRSNLELMQTIIQAAREVIKTCRKTFSDMRWNCSSIELAPNYLLDLERGTRESAFVYALSAAAISHTIARACTTGDLPGCSCGPIPGETPGPGYRWGGCADNLNYGLIMGSKFSDAPMKMKKSGSQANKLMHLHNSEVGRQVLKASLEMKCKCHGVSGSCSIKTCWKGLQELQDIALDLKNKYLSATKVVHRPMGTRKYLVPKDIDIRPVKETELIYLQSSPDFCMKNEKVGSHGTQDRSGWRERENPRSQYSRQCNKTSNGSDSCDLMCCGRGYNPYMDKVVERCHCKYHWCCYVTCKKCERTVERYVCK